MTPARIRSGGEIKVSPQGPNSALASGEFRLASLEPGLRALGAILREVSVDHALGFEMKHRFKRSLEAAVEHDLVELDRQGRAAGDPLGEAPRLLP